MPVGLPGFGGGVGRLAESPAARRLVSAAGLGPPPLPPPPPPPPGPPRGGSGIVARSMPNSFAFHCTYESNAAADSTPNAPPPWSCGRGPMGFGLAPSSRSLSTNSFGAFASTPMRSDASLMFRSYWNGVVTVDGSFGSTPWIALNTSAQSSIVRQIGPTRSCDQASTMPPARLTRPNVGRSALRPHSRAGDTIDPDVSAPMPNATQPAAVADDGPADDPLEPRRMSHGLFVRPRYHWSPCANNPVASFAINTAPALRRRCTTSASSSMTRFSKSFEPHVVRTPFVAKRSFTPYGMPCSGPRYLPAAISLSACAASASA